MNWAQEEMQSISFVDQRLNIRSSIILEALGNKPSVSIPAASGGWAETKAAYNFFQHEDVTSKKILKAHRDAIFKRMEPYNTILFPSDTSEIDYPGSDKIGIVRNENDYGFLLHPIIAITPERLCLGVVNAEIFYRTELGKNKNHKKKPIDEKESYRWLISYRIINNIAEQFPEKTMISIMDREGDIYELLAEAQEEKGKAEWIIRAAQDRRVEVDEGKFGKLWDEIQKSVPLAEVSFILKSRNNVKERVVTQSIHAKRVKLSPTRKSGLKVTPIELNVVLAQEVNPPDGEEPVEWLLLTSLSVEENEKMALEVVKYYLARWEIEIFFKVLKSGCKIEKLQLEHRENLEPCIAIYMIIAWRVMYLMMLGRECPDLDCSIVLHDYEWKSAYVAVKKERPPETPPKLGEMVRIIAALGGFLNRKSDGFPGPKVMWIGIQRMKDIAYGWEIAHSGLLG